MSVKYKTVTEFTWEPVAGLTAGIEVMENPDFDGKGDDLKWVLVLHLGFIRLVFSTYALES